MKDDTKLVAAGRPHNKPAHPVNPPVERASTILFPSYDDFVEGTKAINYGRLGTSSHRALEEAIGALEGAHQTRLASSGLQACVVSILAFVSAGDHVLVTDSVYDPTRRFCDRFLTRFGVETTYYDPMADRESITAQMRPNTKVIFAESPGSLTFEIQDLPMLADVAHSAGAALVVDNTWSGGYFLKPLSLGADISLTAATKYLVGHADCLIGAISSKDEKTAELVFDALLRLGANVSADDAYLALRGMRTLSARLKRHEASALALTNWLDKRDEVEIVLHPAFKSCAGHGLWKRDFTGSSGLFSVVLEETSEAGVKAFFNALKLFGMGYSWGGFESLCIQVRPETIRTVRPWSAPGPVFRIHVGLEDIEDLQNDLSNAFTAMNEAK
ncbi:MAG: cystathionine beta-lyase [Pseudomonadota bacterium]